MTPHPDHAAELRRTLVDVRAVCLGLGLAIDRRQRSPRGVKVLCPSHKENTASCNVSLGRDGTIRVKCFACGFSGDVLTLVAAVRGLDMKTEFPKVLLAAAELGGRWDVIDAIEGKPEGQRRARTVRAVPTPAPAPKEPEPPKLAPEAFEAIVRPLFWVGRLDGSPISADATTYLDGRGMLAAAIGEGWGSLPPSGESQDAWVKMLLDALPTEDLKASGLLWGRGFAHSDNRLLIPWRTPEGTVYTVQRRRLDDDGKPKYVFPGGHPARWPYGIERLASAPADAPLVFVEGAIDVLARRILDASQGKARVVLGVPGGGWRAEWAKLAKGRVASIASDADETGAKFVEEWSGALFKAGAKKVTRIEPMGAHDWGEIVRTYE